MAKTSTEKGVLFLTIAKVYFLIAGYILIYALTRILGPEGYGIMSPVNSLLIILNAVLLIGTIQSVSKFVSEDQSKAEAVKDTAIKLQIFVGGIIAGGYFLLAPFIANLLNDTTLTPFIRLSSVIVLSYSFYGVYLGYINGRKQFIKQSMIDMTFSTIKVGLMVTLSFLAVKYINKLSNQTFSNVDLPVTATFAGFALAAVIIVIILIIITGNKEKIEIKFPLRQLIAFQGTIIVFTLLLNTLLQADLLMVKTFTDNVSTGIYSAALQMSRIPYQLITAVTFVIFPLISEVTSRQDREKAREYIHNTLRFSLLILAFVVVFFATTTKGAMLFLYDQRFLAGADVLAIYVFAVMFFALFFIMTTIISGCGKPGISCIAALITLAITCVLNYIVIPTNGIIGAAIATTIAMFIGMLITSLIIFRIFKGLIKPVNAIRIILVGAIIFIISYYFPVEGKILVAAKFIIAWNVYLALLFLLKELTINDLKILARILPDKFVPRFLK